MRENKIEKYFVEQCDVYEILTRKVKWIGRDGAPDRFAASGGVSVWVEFKTTGKEPRKNQSIELCLLQDEGMFTWVVDTKEGVDEVISFILDNRSLR